MALDIIVNTGQSVSELKKLSLAYDEQTKRLGKQILKAIELEKQYSSLSVSYRKVSSELRVLTAANKTLTVAYNKQQIQIDSLIASMKRKEAADKQGIISQRNLEGAARGAAASLGSLWMAYGAMIPLMTTFAALTAAKTAVKWSAQFEYAATYMTALGGATGDASKEMGVLYDELDKITGLRHGPVELAAGMREFAKAGVEVEVGLANIAEMSRFASVAELDLASATALVIGQSNAFGVSYADAANMITKAATSSATSIGAMAQAMSQTTELGSVSKMAFEEVAAALAVMANSGITGTRAGTAIRTSILRLQSPTSKLTEMMNKLGISFSAFDSNGKSRGMLEMFKELDEKLGQLTDENRVKVVREMFGLRALKGGANLLRMANQGLEEMIKNVDDSTEGITELQRIITQLDNTAVGQWEKIKAVFQSDWVAAGNSASMKNFLSMLLKARLGWSMFLEVASNGKDTLKMAELTAVGENNILSLSQKLGILVEQRNKYIGIIQEGSRIEGEMAKSDLISINSQIDAMENLIIAKEKSNEFVPSESDFRYLEDQIARQDDFTASLLRTKEAQEKLVAEFNARRLEGRRARDEYDAAEITRVFTEEYEAAKKLETGISSLGNKSAKDMGRFEKAVIDSQKAFDELYLSFEELRDEGSIAFSPLELRLREIDRTFETLSTTITEKYLKAKNAADTAMKAGNLTEKEEIALQGKMIGLTASYNSAIADNNKVKAIYIAQDIEALVASNNFFNGLNAGYRESRREMITWGQVGEATFKTIETSMTDALSGSIMGEDGLRNWEDVWKEVTDNILKMFADMLAKMVIQWLESGLMELVVGGSFSGFSIPGFSGSSSGPGGKVATALGAASAASDGVSLLKGGAGVLGAGKLAYEGYKTYGTLSAGLSQASPMYEAYVMRQGAATASDAIAAEMAKYEASQLSGTGSIGSIGATGSGGTIGTLTTAAPILGAAIGAYLIATSGKPMAPIDQALTTNNITPGALSGNIGSSNFMSVSGDLMTDLLSVTTSMSEFGVQLTDVTQASLDAQAGVLMFSREVEGFDESMTGATDSTLMTFDALTGAWTDQTELWDSMIEQMQQMAPATDEAVMSTAELVAELNGIPSVTDELISSYNELSGTHAIALGSAEASTRDYLSSVYGLTAANKDVANATLLASSAASSDAEDLRNLSSALMGMGLTSSQASTAAAYLVNNLDAAGAATSGLSSSVGSMASSMSSAASSIASSAAAAVRYAHDSDGRSAGGYIGYASGGRITGGSGVRDDLDAGIVNGVQYYLTGGEYIINKQATAKNLALLEAINAGRVATYASGGEVPDNSSRIAELQNSNVSVHIYLSGRELKREISQVIVDREDQGVEGVSHI